LEALTPLVYEQLRKLAAGHLRRERTDHTLQATALVHEAFFRLTTQDRVQWRDRAHFFAVAAQAMRRILVDYARRRIVGRRVLDQRLPVALAEGFTIDQASELIEVHQALERLSALSSRQARVVELRIFGGASVAETAAALEVSVPTVVRDWRFAHAWLRRELGGSGPRP
jgi:RNA polymerase sigma factor (TIGR02999 family)